VSINKTASQRVDGAERKIARSLGRDGFVPHPFPGDQASPPTACYVLPWPPSANNSKIPVSLRSKKTGKQVQRQISTSNLKAYKREVVRIAQACLVPVHGVTHVRIDVYPPSRHRRDVANLEKAPVDALVQAGALDDDCLIDHLEIVRHRHQPFPGGRLVISIKPMTPGGALL